MTPQWEQAVAGQAAEARLERLYADHGRALLAYAVRRSPEAQDAADVVAETFLVAWRRLAEVPVGEAARLWLYGVARNVLANQRRAERRRERLAERLRQELLDALDAVQPASSDTGVVSLALAKLGLDDQEILRLSGWEELTPGEIATVLGISRIAARSRLHRARHRLRHALQRVSELEDSNVFCLQEAS